MTSIVVEASKKRRRNKKTCTNHKKWRKTNNDVAKEEFATDMLNIDSISNQSTFAVWIIVYCFETNEKRNTKNEKNLTTGRSHKAHVIRIRNKSRKFLFENRLYWKSQKKTEMTTRKKKRPQDNGGFLKKVSSLFNLDTVTHKLYTNTITISIISIILFAIY